MKNKRFRGKGQAAAFTCPVCHQGAGFMEKDGLGVYGCPKCGFALMLRGCPAHIQQQICQSVGITFTPLEGGDQDV